jgi:hypothetical protein
MNIYYESTTYLSKVEPAHVCLSDNIPSWKAFLTMLSDEIPLSKRFWLG